MGYSTDYHIGHQAGQKDAYHEVFDSMMGFALDRFDNIMHETFVVNDRIDDAVDDFKSILDDIRSELDDIKKAITSNNDSIDNLYDKMGDIEVKIGMEKEEE